jgi:transcriptional regulator with XRE-family HTH domain
MGKTYNERAEELRRHPRHGPEIERRKAAVLAGLRLHEIRKDAGLSQAELAERLGITQSRVSALERAEDVKVSTLQGYVAALGGELHITAEIDGERIELASDSELVGV